MFITSNGFFSVGCRACGQIDKLSLSRNAPPEWAVEAAYVALWGDESGAWLCLACQIADSYTHKGEPMSGMIELCLDNGIPRKFVDVHFFEICAWYNGRRTPKRIRLKWPDDRLDDVDGVTIRWAQATVNGRRVNQIVPYEEFDAEIIKRYTAAWIAHEGEAAAVALGLVPAMGAAHV